MNIPAHRAAAVAPTPAHSFELREGDRLVSLTEEARTAAEAALVLVDEVGPHPAPTEGDPVALATLRALNRTRPSSETPRGEAITEAPIDQGTVAPLPTTKGRKPAGEASIALPVD